MVRIVCVLQSETSFKRIKAAITEEKVQFIYENNIESLKLTLISDYYDLAVLDVNIPNYEDFTHLFETQDIKITNFRGQYDELVSFLNIRIKDFLAKEMQEEEISFLDSTPNENKVSIQKVVKTERIEVPVYQNVANKLISVVNLSERAGSTFIATNLARTLTQRNVLVNLFENPLGTVDLYYALGLHFEEERFYSYRKVLREVGRIDKSKLPIFQGIRVAANEPDYNYNHWDLTDTLRLFSTNSGINIVDIGWNFNEPKIKDILGLSSIILVIVEPNPTQILRNNERLIEFEEMMQEGLNVRYVFNKWDEAINKKRFIEGFEMTPYLIVPFVDIDLIYECLFQKKHTFFVDIPEVGEELSMSFEAILKEHFPTAIEDDSTKKKRFAFFRR